MSLKLLVVDDDTDLLQVVSKILTTVGAEVRPLADAEMAATAIVSENYNGIFLDLKMPKLDGFELTRRARQSFWNFATPVVILTGREEKDTMRDAFSMGGTFYLQKPVDRKQIVKLFDVARGAMGEDKRRFARLESEVVCMAGSERLTGFASSVSENGILFQSPKLLPPGTSVQLEFRLPVQSSISKATGTVGLAGPKQGMAVLFSEIAPRERQTIREMLV